MDQPQTLEKSDAERPDMGWIFKGPFFFKERACDVLVVEVNKKHLRIHSDFGMVVIFVARNSGAMRPSFGILLRAFRFVRGGPGGNEHGERVIPSLKLTAKTPESGWLEY